MSGCAFGQSGLQGGLVKRKWIGRRYTEWTERWEDSKDR